MPPAIPALCRKFSFQHTLRARTAARKSRSNARLLSRWLSSAQAERIFQQRAQACHLHGAGHAAAALDGVPNAPHLRRSSPGDGLAQRLNAHASGRPPPPCKSPALLFPASFAAAAPESPRSPPAQSGREAPGDPAALPSQSARQARQHRKASAGTHRTALIISLRGRSRLPHKTRHRSSRAASQSEPLRSDPGICASIRITSGLNMPPRPACCSAASPFSAVCTVYPPIISSVAVTSRLTMSSSISRQRGDRAGYEIEHGILVCISRRLRLENSCSVNQLVQRTVSKLTRHDVRADRFHSTTVKRAGPPSPLMSAHVRHAQRYRRGQILACKIATKRCLNRIAAPLPQLDGQIVADSHIVEPVRPVLAEPHLAVLALQRGVGVAQILAAARGCR